MPKNASRAGSTLRKGAGKDPSSARKGAAFGSESFVALSKAVETRAAHVAQTLFLVVAPFVVCLALGAYDKAALAVLSLPETPGNVFVLEYCVVLPGILLSFMNLLMAADDVLLDSLRALYRALDVRTPFGRLLSSVLTVSTLCAAGSFAIAVHIFLKALAMELPKTGPKTGASWLPDQLRDRIPASLPSGLSLPGLPSASAALLASIIGVLDMFWDSIGELLSNPFLIVGRALAPPLRALQAYAPFAISGSLREAEVGLLFGGLALLSFSFLFLLSGPQWVKRFVFIMGGVTAVAVLNRVAQQGFELGKTYVGEYVLHLVNKLNPDFPPNLGTCALFCTLALQMYSIYGSVFGLNAIVIPLGGGGFFAVSQRDDNARITSVSSSIITYCYFVMLGNVCKQVLGLPDWACSAVFWVHYAVLALLYASAAATRFAGALLFNSFWVGALIMFSEFMLLWVVLAGGAFLVAQEVFQSLQLHFGDVYVRGWALNALGVLNTFASAPLKWTSRHPKDLVFAHALSAGAFVFIYLLIAHAVAALFARLPRPSLAGSSGGALASLVWPFAVATIAALTILSTPVRHAPGAVLWDSARSSTASLAASVLSQQQPHPFLAPLEGFGATTAPSLLSLLFTIIAAPMAWRYVAEGNRALFGRWDSDGMLNTFTSGVLAYVLMQMMLDRRADFLAGAREHLPLLEPLLEAALRVCAAVCDDVPWVVLGVLLAQNSRVLSGTAVDNSGLAAIGVVLWNVNALVAVFLALAWLAGVVGGAGFAAAGVSAVGGLAQLAFIALPCCALWWAGAKAWACLSRGKGGAKKLH